MALMRPATIKSKVENGISSKASKFTILLKLTE